MLDGLQHLRQLVAQEQAHHRRRGFVRAQAMVVARRGHGDAQQVLIVVHSLDHRAQEQQELGVFKGRGARVQQVHAVAGGDGPVVVLAGAVDPTEGLFVQQAHHAVAVGDLLHQLHGQLVVVGGDVGGGEDRRQLVLGRGHLVVLGLGQDAQPPQLVVQLLHERLHPGLDDAVVVVLQLLALGRLRAQQRAAGQQQVLAGVHHALIHQEVLLLGAHRDHRRGALIAEQLQHPQRLAADGLHAAQQRRLHVQGLAAVAAKGRGDVEHGVLDEGIARRVPGGVAPGLEGGAQAAGGEGGGVGLAAHQLLAGELHDDPAVAVGADEAVVLLGGDAGHRLEPVGEVGRALLDGPVLHGVGHDVGDAQVHALALADAVQHLPIRVLRQALAHGGEVENPGGKAIGDVAHGITPLD